MGSGNGTGSAATLPVSISQHAQSTLPDGRVLVSGGWDSTTSFNTVYIYTPSANTWTETASMPAKFGAHGQVVLADGKVFVSGGSIAGAGALDTTYIYTPSNIELGAWVAATPLPTGISHHGKSLLNDGMVLISGGFSAGWWTSSYKSVYRYNPGTNKWDALATLPVVSAIHKQSTINNDRVFVSGNWGDLDTYMYELDNNRWIQMASVPDADRQFNRHGQSTLSDGNVFISGGISSSGLLNTSYVYTPNASIGSWVSTSPLLVGIGDHGQSTLADGRVLVSGGSTNNSISGAFNTAYIYTPAGWVAHIRVLHRRELVD